MKKILGLFIVTTFIGLSMLAFTPTPSYALPNFAKKHEASCTLCHTVWPALNRFGEQYLMNGFQMPDTEDGGDVGKIKPDEHVALDSGGANQPLAVRLNIEAYLTRDTKTEGASDDSQSALIEPKTASPVIFAGGTIGKNFSYFIDDIAAGGGAEQMWVGLHNIGGPGVVNVRYGVINNADFDAYSNHRHDSGGFLTSSITSGTTTYTLNPAADTNIDPVGLQFYGRPGGGPLTYQVNADIHGRSMTNSLNYGLMLRGDFEPVAVSYHYGANNAAKSAWDSTGKDMTSTSQVLAVRAILPGIEVSAAYALNSQKDNANNDAQVDTNGMILEGIYFTELFDVQLRYSSMSLSEAKSSLGSASNKSDYDRSQISLKADYHATTNSKIYFKYVTDSYKGDSLKSTGVYASTGYNDGYSAIGVDLAF